MSKQSLQLGDQLPAFSLDNQDGKRVESQSLAGNPLVVFFYPKDNTPGCTAEACAFRDEFAEFRNLQATVVGISSDDVASHKKFAEQYNLPFDLLSDTNGSVRKLFGVKGSLFGLLPGRVTYIFDAAGKLVHIFDSQLKATQHIREALEQIAKLPA